MLITPDNHRSTFALLKHLAHKHSTKVDRSAPDQEAQQTTLSNTHSAVTEKYIKHNYHHLNCDHRSEEKSGPVCDKSDGLSDVPIPHPDPYANDPYGWFKQYIAHILSLPTFTPRLPPELAKFIQCFLNRDTDLGVVRNQIQSLLDQAKNYEALHPGSKIKCIPWLEALSDCFNVGYSDINALANKLKTFLTIFINTPSAGSDINGDLWFVFSDNPPFDPNVPHPDPWHRDNAPNVPPAPPAPPTPPNIDPEKPTNKDAHYNTDSFWNNDPYANRTPAWNAFDFNTPFDSNISKPDPRSTEFDTKSKSKEEDRRQEISLRTDD